MLPPAANRVVNPLSWRQLDAGQTVLDLGCGAGLDSLLAARRVGPSGRVFGVDMTREMVEKARRNAAALGLTDVELHHASQDEEQRHAAGQLGHDVQAWSVGLETMEATTLVRKDHSRRRRTFLPRRNHAGNRRLIQTASTHHFDNYSGWTAPPQLRWHSGQNSHSISHAALQCRHCM